MKPEPSLRKQGGQKQTPMPVQLKDSTLRSNVKSRESSLERASDRDDDKMGSFVRFDTDTAQQASETAKLRATKRKSSTIRN